MQLQHPYYGTQQPHAGNYPHQYPPTGMASAGQSRYPTPQNAGQPYYMDPSMQSYYQQQQQQQQAAYSNYAQPGSKAQTMMPAAQQPTPQQQQTATNNMQPPYSATGKGRETL